MLFIFFYYKRWEHIWEKAMPVTTYTTQHKQDDTLRIGFIGDSWAYLHNVCKMDTLLERIINSNTKRPVKVYSCGHKGQITRGIYKNMFKNKLPGTKSLLNKGLNYCIISAGINDAGKNLGTAQYCYHYELIINFLIKNYIKPIIIEIPDANIWKTNHNKPSKEIFIDFIRSIMTKSPMYDCKKYRRSLKTMLTEKNITHHIIYKCV